MNAKFNQLSLVSSVWAVSDAFVASAVPTLESLDVVECAKQQAKHIANAKAARDAAKANGEERKPYQMVGDIALLSVDGPMTKKPTSASWLFGGTSSLETRALLRQAGRDPDVKAILMVWETPGGEVSGLSELADDINAVDAVKPVYSFVDDDCHSAGYYGASQTRAIYMNPMGATGCIGTMWAIPDYSKAYAKAGVKIKLYKTGKYKGAGTAGVPIEEHQDEYFQSIVDYYGADFKARVASGRGLDPDAVEELADGRSYFASDAMALGLIDGVCSLEDCIAAITQSLESGAPIPETFGALPDIPKQPKAEVQPTTISAAQGGSTGPGGAGTKPLERATGGHSMFSKLLVRALTAFGLAKMATALTVADTEDPQEIAATLSKTVDAEVQEKLANDPLMLACKANGIMTAADLAKTIEMKDLGTQYLLDLRGDAHAEAIRCYGDDGPTISAQVANLPAASVKTLRDSWRTEADKKFGIGADGTGAKRVTAAGGTVEVAANAETADDRNANQRPWERLSDEQRKRGLQMGFTKKDQQDEWATTLLKEAA